MPKPKLTLSMPLRAYESLLADRDHWQRECQRLEEAVARLKAEPLVQRTDKWIENAELGAMVLEWIGGGGSLSFYIGSGWTTDNVEPYKCFHTAHEALRAALKEDQPK